MNKFRMSASSRTHSFIIQSFFDLIAYKNFKKITIQDILEESQVSKGTFYKHFIDKYDLLKHAYHYLYEEMKESLFILDNRIDIQNYLYTINRIRIDYTNIIQIKDNEIDIRGNFLKDLSDLYKTEHRDSTPIEANLYANQIPGLPDLPQPRHRRTGRLFRLQHRKESILPAPQRLLEETRPTYFN